MAERAPRLTTPVAIVIGAGLIAVAVYLGLRSSPAQRTDRAPTPQVAGDAPASAASEPVNASPALVQQQAEAALAALKPTWRATCWDPAAAAQPEPARARYTLDVSFDAAGRQVTFGLSETREFSRADVAQCLRDQPMSLRIPSPGAPMRVTLAFELP